jgi:hypothetical protein
MVNARTGSLACELRSSGGWGLLSWFGWAGFGIRKTGSIWSGPVILIRATSVSITALRWFSVLVVAPEASSANRAARRQPGWELIVAASRASWASMECGWCSSRWTGARTRRPARHGCDRELRVAGSPGFS